MSNRCFLIASNINTIYPSFAEENYDAPEQLIATNVEALPLLWLALFRESDIRRTVFQVEGKNVSAYAPVCPKETALAQLDQAIPHLSRIFPELGALAEYGTMFRSGVAPLPYRYLSLELDQIAPLYPSEHRFEELFTLGLRGFERPETIRFRRETVVDSAAAQNTNESMPGVEGGNELLEEFKELMTEDSGSDDEKERFDGFEANPHADVLIRLTSLRPNCSLPSVRMYLDDLTHSDDDVWNFTHVLGSGRYGSMGYGREIPWEKESADFGWYDPRGTDPQM
jgi:hypothetical protein